MLRRGRVAEEAEGWQQIERLYHAVLALPESQRAAFLEQASLALGGYSFQSLIPSAGGECTYTLNPGGAGV